MPQISQIAATYVSQLFWLLLTFGFLYVVVGRMMVPAVASTVDARDRKIADDLAAARAAQDEADKLEETHRTTMEKARSDAAKVTQKAKDRSAKDSAQKLAKADASLADKMVKAEAAIRTAKSKAMTDVEAMASDAAKDIVAKLSGIAVSTADAGKAVKGALHA